MRGLESPELPVVDTQLVGGGFEKDFADVLKQANTQKPTREVPPLHPKTVSISEEEMMKGMPGGTTGQPLFGGAKKKMRCEVGLFNLSDEDQREKYQAMIDNCLQKGWILAREDWQRTPEGGAFAAVKVLIPEGRRKNNKNK